MADKTVYEELADAKKQLAEVQAKLARAEAALKARPSKTDLELYDLTMRCVLIGVSGLNDTAADMVAYAERITFAAMRARELYRTGNSATATPKAGPPAHPLDGRGALKPLPSQPKEKQP